MKLNRVFLVAALTVAAVLLPAASADAAFPGQNGKIAFASNRDGNWEIYSVNPDGSGTTNLTHDPALDAHPVWAPDGRSLVFYSDRDGSPADYVMKPDGSSPIFLCGATSSDFALSPDGNQLVISGFRLETATFTNTWGNCDRRVLPSGVATRVPVWSPDGTKIAYVLEQSPGNGGTIHVINADGTGDVPLTSDSSAEFSPDWSPSGDRIVFRDNGSQFVAPGIYTMRPDGSDVTLVPGTANDYTPAWSPDGSRIAVQNTAGGIDTIALDGSDRITVVGSSTNAPDWQPVTTPVPLYARPKGATPLQVALVPSYRACDAPDRQHGPPLMAGSCSSPQQKSDFLTMGTPDSNGQPAKFRGLVQFDVLPGNPATYADEADVKVTASLEDVRCKVTYPTCEGGPLSDYGGSLYASASIRITDQFNLPPHPAFDAGTVMDSYPLFFTIPCAATRGNVGSTCSLSTTFEAVIPRIVKEGVRSIWQLGQVQVYDGGANGASFDESTLFAVQGIFVP
jgi:TolB protein